MTHLHSFVLFTLCLRSDARHSILIGDSRYYAQQQSNALTKTLEVSEDAREALLPGGFSTGMLHRRSPPAGAMHATHGHGHQLRAPHGQHLVSRNRAPIHMALALAARPKLTSSRPGPNLEPPERIDPVSPPGPRDVVVKVYDISTPELRQALSVLVSKPVYWFPKLSVSVGQRTWSYDGMPEETYDAIIENAAGGPPLRTWNLGPTSLSDAEIDAVIAEMGATDYTPQEYDFFYRNCNHFCFELAERLASPWAAEDAQFIDEKVLHESESLLNQMPGFQQKMTRAVTFQLQKIIVKSWRKQWKRALKEYEREQGVPMQARVS